MVLTQAWHKVRLGRTLLAIICGSLLAGGCKDQTASEAALIVTPGSNIEAQLGPDMFGFAGTFQGAQMLQAYSGTDPVNGRLDYINDARTIRFKYARDTSGSPTQVLKTDIVLDQGILTLRAFAAISPLTIDFSTEKTVQFFEKVLKRDPKSAEEILYVTKIFRAAMAQSCLAGRNLGSLSATSRALNNAVRASAGAAELIQAYALSAEQKSAFYSANAAPTAISGFPYPLIDRVNELTVPEHVSASLEVQVQDSDHDLFLSEWLIDGEPFATARPELKVKEIREANESVDAAFRPTRGFSFSTDYSMSTPAISKRYEIELRLCDGGAPARYQYAINVTNTNRAPELAAPVPTNPIEVTVGQEVSVPISVKDVDGDSLVYFPLTSVIPNLVLSPDAQGFEAAHRLQGRFDLNGESRSRSNADIWPELGNPWLEGPLGRGTNFDPKQTPPQSFTFYTDGSGANRAKVKLINASGSLTEQDVPVSYDYYVDPVSGLKENLRFKLGDDSAGLNIARPFNLNSAQIFCNAMLRGYGAGLSFTIGCGVGRYPQNLDKDGEWIADYKCPDAGDLGSNALSNPRCMPIAGNYSAPPSVQSTSASSMNVIFRPEASQFQDDPISQTILVSDLSGGVLPITLKFKVLDATQPKVAPLRLTGMDLYRHFLLANNNPTPFTSAPATTSAGFDDFARSPTVVSRSLLKPYLRSEEAEGSFRNVFDEPPGSVQKWPMRGLATFEKSHWWQHVRWELEDSSLLPTGFYSLANRKFLRFLSTSNGQPYPKLVLSKAGCSTGSCSLFPYDSNNTTTTNGNVLNATDAEVLEYEVLESKGNYFSFKILHGAAYAKPLYCRADLRFSRNHVPNPPGSIPTEYVEPLHNNFRLQCSDVSLAEAIASTSNYLQFGPGLAALMSEDANPAYPEHPVDGAGGDIHVNPSRSHQWFLRSCALYKNASSNNGQSCLNKPKLSSTVTSSIVTSFSNGVRIPHTAEPTVAGAWAQVPLVTGTNPVYMEVDPSTQRIRFPGYIAGNNYRWCRYGLSNRLTSMTLTCQRDAPLVDLDASYPDLFQYDAADVEKYATLQVGYATEIDSSDAAEPLTPVQGFLGSAIPGIHYDLTDRDAGGEQKRVVTAPLPASKRGLVVFKLSYDDIAWRRVNSLFNPPRPVYLGSTIYKMAGLGSSGGSYITDNPLSVWKAGTDGLGRIEKVSSELTDAGNISKDLVGVQRLQDNEFLVAWQTDLADADYEFDIAFTQPGLTGPSAETHFKTRIHVYDFKFPPTLAIKDYGINTSWVPPTVTGAYNRKVVQPSGAPSIFMKPVRVENGTPDGTYMSLSVASTKMSYIMTERDAARIVDFSLLLKSEDPKVSAFWVTQYDPATKRTTLVNPDTDASWFEKFPFAKDPLNIATGSYDPGDATVASGVIMSDPEAFLYKASSQLFVSPAKQAADGSWPSSAEASRTLASNLPMKLIPRVPTNAMLQETCTNKSCALDLSNAGSLLFRAAASGSSLKNVTLPLPSPSPAAGLPVQFFVAGSGEQSLHLQDTVKIRLGALDFVADLHTGFIGGTPASLRQNDANNSSNSSPGAVVIHGVKRDGSNNLVADAASDISCRIFLLYENPAVYREADVALSLPAVKGSRTTLRLVCKDGSTIPFNFPSALDETTPLASLGTAPFTGLFGIEAYAENIGAPTGDPFTLKQVAVSSSAAFGPVPGSPGKYAGEVGRVTWGIANSNTSLPHLKPEEAGGEFSGVIAVTDGTNVILQPVSVKTVRRLPTATTAATTSSTVSPCASSYSKVLRAASSDPSIVCELPKYTLTDANANLMGAPVHTLAFQAKSAPSDVGQFIHPDLILGSTPAVDAAIAQRSYFVDAGASAWTNYNAADTYKPKFKFQSTGFSQFIWAFPTFARVDISAKATTVRWLAGVDHYRNLFAPDRNGAFAPDSEYLVSRLNVNPGNYNHPVKILGERDIEWGSGSSNLSDPGTWENQFQVNFDEENLPPCIVSGNSYAIGATCPTADQIAVDTSFFKSYMNLISPTPGTPGNVLDIAVGYTKGVLASDNITVADIVEGTSYNFKIRAFDQNNSASGLRTLGQWTSAGGLAPNPTTQTTDADGKFKEATISYLPLDSHINRSSPLSTVDLTYTIGDSITTGTNQSADASYTLKLSVWDVNQKPLVTPPASPVSYTGTSTLTARQLSFTVKDSDIADGVEVRYLGTSADVYVTCNDITAGQAATYALKTGDLLFRIETNGVSRDGTPKSRTLNNADGTLPRCGAESWSTSGSNSSTTPTYTFTLKFWDSTNLAGITSTAFNFEIRDIPWWKLSSWTQPVTGKRYNELHPQPALIAPAKPQIVSVLAQLSAPPALQNNFGALTTTGSGPNGTEYRKVVKIYQNQTLIEPMAIYNPNRLPVSCRFDDTSNSYTGNATTGYTFTNTQMPNRLYRNGQTAQGKPIYAAATDRPMLLNLNPITATTCNTGSGAGCNVYSTSPTAGYSMDNATAKIVPSMSGCVLVWRPSPIWFNDIAADEPRTSRIRVHMTVGSYNFYQVFYVGEPGTTTQYFIGQGNPQWSDPESNGRPSLASINWRYILNDETTSTAASPTRPSPASSLPNIVLDESDKLEFRLTNGTSDFSIPQNSLFGVTWYLDGVPVAADVPNYIYKTDFLSSGEHTAAVLVHEGSTYGDGVTSPGYRKYSTRFFVRNTLPFAEPLASRAGSANGFIRVNTAVDANKFQIFHLASLGSMTNLVTKGFAAIANSSSSTKPVLGRFNEPAAPTLPAPFPTPTPAPTVTTNDNNAISQTVPYVSSLVGNDPLLRVGTDACRSSPNAACSKNSNWQAAPVAAPYNLSWGSTVSSQTYASQQTAATSFRNRGRDRLYFKAGSNDFAYLDYSAAGLPLTIRGSSVSAPGGETRFASIAGGMAADGTEDGSWLVAVAAPTAGGGTAYLVQNLGGSPTWKQIQFNAVSGWAPAFVWLAECGECSDPTNQRKILFLSQYGGTSDPFYRARWGWIDLTNSPNVTFHEKDASDTVTNASATKCASSGGCAKFDMDPTIGPTLTGSSVEPIWHTGHLFPAQYDANTLGNDTFVIIERSIGTYRALDLKSGDVAKLAVPGGELTTLHCSSKQSFYPLDLTKGRMDNPRCYVGDTGNEGVNQLR